MVDLEIGLRGIAGKSKREWTIACDVGLLPSIKKTILAKRSVVPFEAVAPELSDSRGDSVRKRRLERIK